MEIQQLKAKNHGLNTQIDALAADHERLASLLDTAEKVRAAARAGFVGVFLSPSLPRHRCVVDRVVEGKPASASVPS